MILWRPRNQMLPPWKFICFRRRANARYVPIGASRWNMKQRSATDNAARRHSCPGSLPDTCSRHFTTPPQATICPFPGIGAPAYLTRIRHLAAADRLDLILLASRLNRLLCEIEVAHLVVRIARIPDPSLRIAKEFAHIHLRVREWIFRHLAGFGVKASDRVHMV